MWQRFLGRSDKPDSSSASSRRKDDSRPQRKGSESAIPSSSTQKQPRGDDRDRGINPSSYPSSGRSLGGAAPSEASSTYATAQTEYNDDLTRRSDSARNSTIANTMPRTRSEREDRDRDGEKDRKSGRRRDRSLSQDRKGHRRERSRSEERSSKGDKRKPKRRSTDPIALEYAGSSRAGEMDGSSSQLRGAGFPQFPGQFESGVPPTPGSGQHPPQMSDHVPDMFPGQFPAGATAPYRPPMAKSEGGPGLASEYYGDAGQSVADQPGVRIQSPNLIIGTEPHLMMASSVAAPPPEPSSVGQEGSAAAFFNSEASFQTPTTSPKPGPQSGPRPQGAPYIASGALSPGLPPQSFSGQSMSVPPTTSTNAIPTLGAAAAGAAAGYAMGHHSSSEQNLTFNSYQGPGPQELPGSESSSPLSSGTRPPKSGKHSSSNVPLAAAAAAGAAGLAAASFQHHHQSHQNSYQYPQGSSTGNPMVHQHRHQGPFAKFVDFFRDPEGVAEFEEYTEYIGVCRGCFEPGSSPRDAPRKHHYRRKLSSEKMRASTRVDKENRYYVSSDGEGRRRSKNWLAATAAGVGLAQVGKSLFGDPNDFQDTYSVKSGRGRESATSLPRRSSPPTHRKVSFKGEPKRYDEGSFSRKAEYGVTVDNDILKRVSRKSADGDSASVTHVDRKDNRDRRERRRSRSRSQGRDHELRDAAIGAAASAAVASAASQKRRTSPDHKKVRHSSHPDESERKSRHSRRSPEPSTGMFGGFFSSPPDRHRGSQRKKENKGFFNFGNGSSSSSDGGGLTFGSTGRRKGSKRKSSPKIKSNADANAALIGLGAAAAALAAHEGHSKASNNRGPGIVAVKDTKGRHRQHADPKRDRVDKRSRSGSLQEEDLWESASEDEGYSSADSALAFGISRHGSRESLAESGTDKWDWRWGNKKPRRPSQEGRDSHYPTPAVSHAAAGIATIPREHYQDSAIQSTGSLQSMQHVHPVPTSDPTQFDAVRHDPVTGRPTSSTRPEPVPIQQPRPIVPVPAAVYTQAPQSESFAAPSGPPVFSHVPASASYDGVGRYESPVLSTFPTRDDARKDQKHRRRESSPVRYGERTVRSRNGSSTAQFDWTDEGKKSQRERDREERHKSDKAHAEPDRREYEEQLVIDRETRDSKHSGRNYKRDSGRPDITSKDTRTFNDGQANRREAETAQDVRSQRHAEIEQELQRLIKEEPPASKPRKQRDGHGVEYALAGAAAGATATALARSYESSDERREKRREGRWRDEQESGRDVGKSSDNSTPQKRKGGFGGLVEAALASEKSRDGQGPEETIVTVEPSYKMSQDEIREESFEDDQRSRERKVARQAAAKVRIARSPSPAAHESYASYFAPDDILSKPAGEKQKAVDPNADASITAFNVTVEPPRSRGQYVEPDIPHIENEELDYAFIESKDLPWRVPPLNLIHPTPAVSRVGSRAGSVQPSPVIAPRDEPPEEEEDLELSRKVSFGDNQTHEYEVITPEEHRTEFIVSPPGTAKSQEDQARSSKSPVIPADLESPVEEIQRSALPGMFDDDPEFAATLAAGAEAAGFNPDIVIDDPTYRRRDSPPGSQERKSFYSQPFYETVSDIAMESSRSRGAPPQRGWVEEGELPETPKDDVPERRTSRDSKDSDPGLSRKERRKQERAAKRRSTGDEVLIAGSQNESGRKDTMDPDDAELEIIEDAAQDTPEAFEPAKSKQSKRKSKRDSILENDKSSTFDIENEPRNEPRGPISPEGRKEQDVIRDEAFETPLPDKNGESMVSPHDAKSKGSVQVEEEELYESPNEYAASTTSAPLTNDRESRKKGKKKSKRRSAGVDDTASVVSSPAKIEESIEPKSKSKKKGGLFGLFGRTSEEDSEQRESQEPSSKTTNDFEEPKKKSRKSRKSRDENDFDQASVEPQADKLYMDDNADDWKSRKAQKEERRRSRYDSLEDGDSGRRSRDLSDKAEYLNSDEVLDSTSRRGNKDEPESFLGMRQEETEPPDIRRNAQDPGGGSYFPARRSSSSPPTSRPGTPPRSDWTNYDASAPAEPSPSTARRLSLFGLDSAGSPVTPSPTAVPIMFRKPPSAGLVRSSSATPMSSPSLATPRTRRPRPLSTEFKTNEIRPLWLLERHQSKQDFDPNEVLPSLPSSQSGSRASSVHEGENVSRGHEREPKFKGEPLDIAATQDRGHDVLDSQQTTPTLASYKAKSDQERRERAKALEQDLIAQATQESLEREREWDLRHGKRSQQRQEHDSSSFWKGAGLAALAGTAAAVAFAPSDKKDSDSSAKRQHSNERAQSSGDPKMTLEQANRHEDNGAVDGRHHVEVEYSKGEAAKFTKPSTDEYLRDSAAVTDRGQVESPRVAAEADNFDGFISDERKKGKKAKGLSSDLDTAEEGGLANAADNAQIENRHNISTQHMLSGELPGVPAPSATATFTGRHAIGIGQTEKESEPLSTSNVDLAPVSADEKGFVTYSSTKTPSLQKQIISPMNEITSSDTAGPDLSKADSKKAKKLKRNKGKKGETSDTFDEERNEPAPTNTDSGRIDMKDAIADSRTTSVGNGASIALDSEPDPSAIPLPSGDEAELLDREIANAVSKDTIQTPQHSHIDTGDSVRIAPDQAIDSKMPEDFHYDPAAIQNLEYGGVIDLSKNSSPSRDVPKSISTVPEDTDGGISFVTSAEKMQQDKNQEKTEVELPESQEPTIPELSVAKSKENSLQQGDNNTRNVAPLQALDEDEWPSFESKKGEKSKKQRKSIQLEDEWARDTQKTAEAMSEAHAETATPKDQTQQFVDLENAGPESMIEQGSYSRVTPPLPQEDISPVVAQPHSDTQVSSSLENTAMEIQFEQPQSPPDEWNSFPSKGNKKKGRKAKAAAAAVAAATAAATAVSVGELDSKDKPVAYTATEEEPEQVIKEPLERPLEEVFAEDEWASPVKRGKKGKKTKKSQTQELLREVPEESVEAFPEPMVGLDNKTSQYAAFEAPMSRKEKKKQKKRKSVAFVEDEVAPEPEIEGQPGTDPSIINRSNEFVDEPESMDPNVHSLKDLGDLAVENAYQEETSTNEPRELVGRNTPENETFHGSVTEPAIDTNEATHPQYEQSGESPEPDQELAARDSQTGSAPQEPSATNSEFSFVPAKGKKGKKGKKNKVFSWNDEFGEPQGNGTAEPVFLPGVTRSKPIEALPINVQHDSEGFVARANDQDLEDFDTNLVVTDKKAREKPGKARETFSKDLPLEEDAESALVQGNDGLNKSKHIDDQTVGTNLSEAASTTTGERLFKEALEQDLDRKAPTTEELSETADLERSYAEEKRSSDIDLREHDQVSELPNPESPGAGGEKWTEATGTLEGSALQESATHQADTQPSEGGLEKEQEQDSLWPASKETNKAKKKKRKTSVKESDLEGFSQESPDTGLAAIAVSAVAAGSAPTSEETKDINLELQPEDDGFATPKKSKKGKRNKKATWFDQAETADRPSNEELFDSYGMLRQDIAETNPGNGPEHGPIPASTTEEATTMNQTYPNWAEGAEADVQEPDVIEYERDVAQEPKGGYAHTQEMAISKAEQEEFERAMAEMNQTKAVTAPIQSISSPHKETVFETHSDKNVGQRAEGLESIKDSPQVYSADEPLRGEAGVGDQERDLWRSETQSQGSKEEVDEKGNTLMSAPTKPHALETSDTNETFDVVRENSPFKLTGPSPTFAVPTREAEPPADDLEGFANVSKDKNSKKSKRSKKSEQFLSFDDEPANRNFEPEHTAKTSFIDPIKEEVQDLGETPMPEGSFETSVGKPLEDEAPMSQDVETENLPVISKKKGKKEKKGKKTKAFDWIEQQEQDNNSNILTAAVTAAAGVGAAATAHYIDPNKPLEDAKQPDTKDYNILTEFQKDDIHSDEPAVIDESKTQAQTPLTQTEALKESQVRDTGSTDILEAEPEHTRKLEREREYATYTDASKAESEQELIPDPGPEFEVSSKKDKKPKKAKKRTQTLTWDEPAPANHDDKAPNEESSYPPTAEATSAPSLEEAPTSQEAETPRDTSSTPKKGKNKKNKKNKKQCFTWDDPEEQTQVEDQPEKDQEQMRTGLPAAATEPSVNDVGGETDIAGKYEVTMNVEEPDSVLQTSAEVNHTLEEASRDKSLEGEQYKGEISSTSSRNGKTSKRSEKQWSLEAEVPDAEKPPLVITEEAPLDSLDGEQGHLSRDVGRLTAPPKSQASEAEEMFQEEQMEPIQNDEESREIPSTAPISQPEDEPFGIPAKKSKKGKKGKKDQSRGPEAEGMPIIPPADQGLGNTYNTSEAIIDDQRKSFMEESAVLQEEQVPEDDWAGFPPTKRKKGKKGKRQQPTVEKTPKSEFEEPRAPSHLPEEDTSKTLYQEPEEMENNHLEEARIGPRQDNISTDHQPVTEAIADQTERSRFTETAAAVTVPGLLRHEDSIIPPRLTDFEAEPSAEPDYTMTTSKKGKKGNKKRKDPFFAEDEVSGQADTTMSTPLANEVTEPQRFQTVGEEHQTSDSFIGEAMERNETKESSTSRSEAVNLEDEWSTPASGKGKKGKKSKRRSSGFGSIAGGDQPPDQRDEKQEARQTSTDPSILTHSRSSSIKSAAKGVGAVGASIALFEGIHRAASISEEQPAKVKGRKSSKTEYMDTPVFEENLQQNEDERDSYAIERTPSFPPNQQYDSNVPEPSYRDSGLQMESPMIPDPSHRYEGIRDSGFQDGSENVDRSLRVSVEADPHYDISISRTEGTKTLAEASTKYSEPHLPSPIGSRQTSPQRDFVNREPSPVDSTTKDRSASLFGSSPSTRDDQQLHSRHRSIDEVTSPMSTQPRSLFGGPAGISSDRNQESLRSPPKTPIDFDTPNRPLTTIEERSPEDLPRPKTSRHDSDAGKPERPLKPARRSITPHSASQHRLHSPNSDSPRRLGLISTDDLISRLSWPEVDEEQHAVDLERSLSRNTDKSRRSSSRQNRPPSLVIDPNKARDQSHRSASGASVRSNESISAIIKSPPLSSTGTPPLRRIDRSLSSDLRAANRKEEPRSEPSLGSVEADPEKHAKPGSTGRGLESQQLEGVASSSTYDPAKDKGKGRIVKMADVYEGYGDLNGSPRSPTRPPSMRRRQSLQIMDLESRLDQLVSENRLLVDAKNRAERGLDQAAHDHSQENHALNEALQTRDLYLRQKDAELDELKRTLQGLQEEVGRLGEANRTLGESRNVNSEYEQRYQDLENEHNAAQEQLEEQSHELEQLRHKHTSLSGGMEGIVAAEVALAVQSKDAELKQLRGELEMAKQQVRTLQQEIMAARRSDDVLVEHDEDYFDTKCEQLCRHVQQWVMRFSKFSDNKICRRMEEVTDEKITDRFDNAILDGTDVDIYLTDRVKRRDVFMSVVMSMVWEYIFTRYLFGMDREQRQKLKYLEKTLSEVGSPGAVNRWRAITLTMLAKRDAFHTQRQQDTEAVVHEIYNTLSAFLSPPSHLTEQIQESLRKVLSTAVDLSIEMRTQKAEYIMLPPLQPEYNTNGDLETKVSFNAASMNERSGDIANNQELEETEAVVRIVLFPLVIKQSSEEGEENEREVICPAQVLVAKEDSGRDKKGKRSVRVMSAQGNRSQGSIAPSQMEGGYI